ncbi:MULTISPECIES: ABC transporter substrate-binding protein [Brevibacterium]|uniref:Peptide/nickel transport system substrate-binding protein n=2 Tax=Brevibacterium TaxID=1696 RepID=A0A1H1TEW6_BRESA|nr:ABC transporter substrate-binding protein [Brevibacterium sandarakinum]SDS58817.1 peptide/nickel transport system substrate-binding protein [Brevibacterium sandarakinum]
MKRRTGAKAVAIAAAGALLLSACSTSTTGGDGDGGGESLTVGTTDKVVALDPAGAYDNGSSLVEQQIYPFILAYKPGTAELNPSIAESADFSEPTKYEVKLKDGMKFANGNELTSSDVKFSFDRQLKIQDPNGPSSLLGGLESVETPDESTVIFNLKRKNDQTWPGVLASAAGPIVDEDVFEPDKITENQAIVDGKAFAGPYTIAGFDFNKLITYKAYDGYQGYLEPAKTETVQMKYFSDANNMKLDVQEGKIDVAWRSLSATDIEDLGTKEDLKVHKGPGGEIRYIVFNMDTMPFGAKTENADEEKSLAVRQAMADSVDRQAIASQVYKDTFTPLYSHVPEGLPGADDPLKSEYGDGQGGPDVDKAKKALKDAGVETPVKLNLQYNPDHYGPSSGDEYALVKDQLDKTGLFDVSLQSTEWVQYNKDRTADAYPMYQLGWFPDYSDADNYLVPFFYDTDETPSFLGNHYRDKEMNKQLNAQSSIDDKGKRAEALKKIQGQLAEELPTLPLLQGSQIAVSGKDVKGVDDTLDPAFQFRLALLSK